ncbi:MAG: DMT family transporter [Rhizobiaceae bacterium]
MTVQTNAPAAAMSLKDWSLLTFLAALWGGSFFFARIAVAELHPLTLVLLRVAIAALALNLYLLATGRSLGAARGLVPAFFVMGLLNNIVPFSLMFAGQTELGAGMASVLNATTPFWTIMLAAALGSGEKTGWNKVAGILLGIAGTAVMMAPGVLAGLGGPVWAKFALIGTAVSYACAALYARRLRGVAPALIATGQLTASTVVMVPLVAILLGKSWMPASVSSQAWTSVVALALLCTSFGYILFFRLMASAGAVNTSLVTLIVPVFAMLLGGAFLGERLETFEIAGMILVGFGLLVIDGRLFGRR